MSMVEFRHVTKKFGENIVFADITLSVESKEVVVIIGPSGAGKSTLLRCVNALEPIDSGDIIVDGMSVLGNRATTRVIRREAGMVFQQFNLFPQMTALENVAFGPRKVRGATHRQAREQAAALLEKVGLADKMRLYPRELSGGQQQRVAIARSLAVKPKLMLFDEPTSALDPELRYEVLRVMRDLAEEDMTMIVVTHEMSFARDVGTRVLFMEHGMMAADGTPEEILVNPTLPRLQEFIRHVSN